MSKGVDFSNNVGPVTINNEVRNSRFSILGRLVEIIATSEYNEVDLERTPADIDLKVNFNNINGHQWIIEDYIDSSLIIDESIKELNKTILNGSTKLKRQMNIFYKRSLDKYSISTRPFDLDELKLKSDLVVAEVISMATNMVKGSSNLKDGYFEEDIEHGIALITSYSIIECIVLENPSNHN